MNVNTKEGRKEYMDKFHNLNVLTMKDLHRLDKLNDKVTL